MRSVPEALNQHTHHTINIQTFNTRSSAPMTWFNTQPYTHIHQVTCVCLWDHLWVCANACAQFTPLLWACSLKMLLTLISSPDNQQIFILKRVMCCCCLIMFMLYRFVTSVESIDFYLCDYSFKSMIHVHGPVFFGRINNSWGRIGLNETLGHNNL